MSGDALLQRLRRDARRDPLAAARLKAEEARRRHAVRCVASLGEGARVVTAGGNGNGDGNGYGDGDGNGYGDGGGGQ